MIDDTSIVMGALWTAEEFSVLTISPAFIIQVIFAIGALFVVFYLDAESWKEFLTFLVMTIVASFFVSLYAMAWYVRIKYDTSPDFTASFGLDSFPRWGAFLNQMIHGPNVTQHALLHAVILFLTRKYNDWYMWPVKVVFIFFVSLFFIKYVPVVFNWLIT